MSQSPKIALVLGAGSARGLAHIGVLQVLVENRIPFECIVGCSMGAMVGGLYACGTDMVMLGRMIDSMDLRCSSMCACLVSASSPVKSWTAF